MRWVLDKRERISAGPVAGFPAIIALLLFGFEAFRHPSPQAFGLIALAFSAIVLALISRAYTVRLQPGSFAWRCGSALNGSGRPLSLHA